MRRFRFRQNIPTDPLNLDHFHREDMRGRIERKWPQYHTTWIAMWNDRYNRLIEGINFIGNGHLCDTITHMQWYINHAIRYISHLQPSFDDDVSHLSLITNLGFLFMWTKHFSFVLQYDTPQESTQPPPNTPYQHVGSSSYVEQLQYQSFQPLPFPPYLDAS